MSLISCSSQVSEKAFDSVQVYLSPVVGFKIVITDYEMKSVYVTTVIFLTRDILIGSIRA